MSATTKQFLSLINIPGDVAAQRHRAAVTSADTTPPDPDDPALWLSTNGADELLIEAVVNDPLGSARIGVYYRSPASGLPILDTRLGSCGEIEVTGADTADSPSATFVRSRGLPVVRVAIISVEGLSLGVDVWISGVGRV